jgi:hypothetical protein
LLEALVEEQIIMMVLIILEMLHPMVGQEDIVMRLMTAVLEILHKTLTIALLIELEKMVVED